MTITEARVRLADGDPDIAYALGVLADAGLDAEVLDDLDAQLRPPVPGPGQMGLPLPA